jgi:hypothetical protein
MYTLADAIVPDGWHTTVAALVEFTGIFLPPSIHRDVKQNYWLLVPLLAGRGRCPPGYGNNDVNRNHHPLASLSSPPCGGQMMAFPATISSTCLP